MISRLDKLLFYLGIYEDVTELDLDTGKMTGQLSRLKESTTDKPRRTEK